MRSLTAPSVPTGLASTIIDGTSVLVGWGEPDTPNGPIDGYAISIAEIGREDAPWIDLERDSSSYEISNPVLGTVYTVLLYAYNTDEDKERLRSEYAELKVSTRKFNSIAREAILPASVFCRLRGWECRHWQQPLR